MMTPYRRKLVILPNIFKRMHVCNKCKHILINLLFNKLCLYCTYKSLMSKYLYFFKFRIYESIYEMQNLMLICRHQRKSRTRKPVRQKYSYLEHRFCLILRILQMSLRLISFKIDICCAISFVNGL